MFSSRQMRITPREEPLGIGAPFFIFQMNRFAAAQPCLERDRLFESEYRCAAAIRLVLKKFYPDFLSLRFKDALKFLSHEMELFVG